LVFAAVCFAAGLRVRAVDGLAAERVVRVRVDVVRLLPVALAGLRLERMVMGTLASSIGFGIAVDGVA
jgi:hypothetical protein